MRKDTPLERLYNGIIKENPTFVMMLGMCPTLAVTTSAKNGIGMGLATMVILTASNLMISLLRKIIPDGVRMPAYIVVVGIGDTVNHVHVAARQVEQHHTDAPVTAQLE